MSGQVGGVRVECSCREDPLEDMVQGTEVFISGGSIEGAPDVTLVGRWLHIEMMEPEEDGGPGGV
jgi:hypothetical protein